MRFDLVDAVHGSLIDPTNVLDARVRRLARTVPAAGVIDPRAEGRGEPLKAQGVTEGPGDVEVDVSTRIPRSGDLHQTGPVAAAIVDRPIAVVVEAIARLLAGAGAISRDFQRRRDGYDRYQFGRLDESGLLLGLLDLSRSLACRSVHASSGAREQKQRQSDPDSFPHPAGTIAEVAYNAGAIMEALEQAKQAIAQRAGRPEIAVVLGSGLGDYADSLEGARAIPYGEVPHMPLSSVSGHAGNFVVGEKAGKSIIAMQGRTHLYEGHSAQDVVFGVRLMAWLGAKTLIVTNAAGGISRELEAGDLMAITDQLNLTGRSCLTGPNEQRRGPRFLDMSRAFDPELLESASGVASRLGFALKRGVYAGLLGPAYETPAEVRMLATLGADAVGMSTVLEVIAARQMGLRVLGISCISNLAAGIADGALSHEEVTETARRVRPRFEALLSGVLESI